MRNSTPRLPANEKREPKPPPIRYGHRIQAAFLRPATKLRRPRPATIMA